MAQMSIDEHADDTPKGHGSKLAGRIDEVVAAVLQHGSDMAAAAEQLGVSKSTLCRWLRLDSVKARRRELQAQVVAARFDKGWSRADGWTCRGLPASGPTCSAAS